MQLHQLVYFIATSRKGIIFFFNIYFTLLISTIYNSIDYYHFYHYIGLDAKLWHVIHDFPVQLIMYSIALLQQKGKKHLFIQKISNLHVCIALKANKQYSIIFIFIRAKIFHVLLLPIFHCFWVYSLSFIINLRLLNVIYIIINSPMCLPRASVQDFEALFYNRFQNMFFSFCAHCRRIEEL